jgi:RHS repeat-associated protein
MQKSIFLTIIYLISLSVIHGQEISESFTLDEEIPANTTKDMLARDFIQMKTNYPETGNFSSNPDAANFVHADTDPFMVIPPYGDETGGSPNNNGGGAVGSLPGNLMVTPMGAAVYNIPIQLPGGITNLTPELSFVYNSQAGDGILGPGWSLSGLSKISRVPFTKYYNNKTGSVVLNADDQLMIDGNYMVNMGDGIYKKEVEDYSKIVLIDVVDIEKGFRVYKKNGLIYTYGSTENSRYYLQSGPPIAWYLTSIYDMHENYINFYYINNKTDGSFRPDFITYTGNASQYTYPYYKIQFNYQPLNRTDTPKKYFTDPENTSVLSSRITKLLSSVELKYLPESKVIAEYQLYYAAEGSGGKKYLKSITPNYDMNGTRSNNNLNPTKFEWEHSNYVIDSEETTLSLMYDDIDNMFFQHSVIAANFVDRHLDEMALSDFLHVSKTTDDNKFKLRAYTNMSQYGASALGFNFHTNVNMVVNEFDDNGGTVIYVSTGDFDGDGYDEIIRAYHLGSTIHAKIGEFDFETPDNGYTDSEHITIGGMEFNSVKPPKFFTGDFTGNGYTDLCVMNLNGTNGFCYFYLTDKDDALGTFVSQGGDGFQFPEQVLPGDYNGNGKSELFIRGDDEIYVIGLSTDNSTVIVDHKPSDTDIEDGTNFMMTGDFNSDAKTDLLLLKGGAEDNWIFYYSYGKCDFLKKTPQTLPNIGNYEVPKFAVDVNGDGYSDIAVIRKDVVTVDVDVFYKYYRTDYLIYPGSTDIEVVEVGYDDPVAVIEKDVEKAEIDFCLGNFSGNSSNQIVSSRVLRNVSSGSINLYAKLNLSGPLYNSNINCVDKIINGMGVETKINYCPFSAVPLTGKSMSEGFSRTTDLTFPLTNYGGILNVVTSYEQEVEESFTPDHEQKFLSMKYSYSGAKYHKAGKGFLGFDKIQKTDNLKSTYTNNYYEVNDTYYHILNTGTETFQSGGKKISTTDYKYEFDDLDDLELLRYSFRTSEVLNKYYDVTGATGFIKAEKTTMSGFDGFGNPETIKNYFSNTDNNTWPITKTKTINYLNITGIGVNILGLVDNIKTIHSSSDDISRTKKVDYEYDLTNGQLLSETHEKLLPDSYTVTYTYDNGLSKYGNLTEEKLTAETGIAPRITSHTYSTDGRFRLSTTNAEGHVESYDYYSDIGKLYSHTDPNDQVTTYEYDVLGNVRKVTYPNGTLSYSVNRWCIEGSSNAHEDAPSIAVYYNWAIASGNPEILTFYDQFNREVRNVSIGFDGSSIYKDKKYYGETNILTGLAYYESNPYIKSEDPLYEPPATTTSYNNLRQVTNISRPDNSYSSVSYSKNTKTIVDFDGQTKKLEYDGEGRLKKVTDNNEAYIRYYYRSDGLLKSTTLNGDVTTNTGYVYDAFGRAETVTRPNNGTTSFTYNAFGDIVTETDELSSFTYQTDKLGRIIKFTAPDFTSVWQYDTQEFGIGKLHYSAHAPVSGDVQSVIVENVYNGYGNLIKQKQRLNEKMLEFGYRYDVFGRLKQTMWPSGFITTNNYNEFGYQVSILDNNSEQLWKGTEMNPMGQYTKTTLGNDINKEYAYDINNGNITDISVVNDASFQKLQNHHYNWTTYGNLEHRKNELLELKESFTYDEYNRLETVKLNNVPQLDMNFEPSGNINTRDDLGTYGYGTTKPHAVKELDNVPDVISRNYQNIDYTSFDKAYFIGEKLLPLNENYITTLNIGYDSDNNRIWQKFNDFRTGEIMEKRYFNAVYEEMTDERGSVSKRHYIVGPNGTIAIFTNKNDALTVTNYILTDHLGSINYVLDENGIVEQELSYDAWGRRRNPATWTNYSSTTTPTRPLFERGYTMHEHIDAFKLINMNGRMYDPVVARFLSPDPIIQSPENTQSYNSYSYVMNNPLRFTDPSGFVALDNCDWFVNGVSGDVYYNSEYKKGDEDKIEGEGWEHFAENGKLNASGEESVDLNILLANQDLTDDLTVTEAGKVRLSPDKTVSSFSSEATFKGKDAEVLMSGQGYRLAPVTSYEEIRHDFPVNQILPGGGSVVVNNLSGVQVVTERTYVAKDKIGTKNINLFTIVSESVNSHTTYTRTNYTYSKRNWLSEKLKSIMPYIESTQGSHRSGSENIKIVNSWDNINKNSKLNEFKGK